MKKLGNTEDELKKSVAYKKRVYYEKSYSFFSWKLLLTYAK